MPTTTWIQETVEDRYWEGRETVGRPAPPVFPCAVCGREFDTSDGRSWHATEAHPLARPMLYLGDRAAPSEVVLRKPLAEDALSIGSCTSARVALDGRDVDGVEPAELVGLVAALRSAHVLIELENHRAADDADVRATYVFRVAVPEPEELAAVDRAFVDHLAVDLLSTRDVEAFAGTVAGLSTARAYAGALADYVHGVLVKEGTERGGATLPFGAFPAKFNRALAELSDHVERPVPAAVVGAARLNLNDLVTPVAATGDRRLDACAKTLHDAAAMVREPTITDRDGGVSAVPLCPIDSDTDFVLIAHQAIVVEDTSAEVAGELENRVEDATVSATDRSKLRVLATLAFLRRDDRRRARRHLEALAHDEVFGAWAERALESGA